jgi:hypothetical protein
VAGVMRSDDGDHQRRCRALLGKVRCPLREGAMALGLSRPEVPSLPEHPPLCCTQPTVTVPASVNAKTAERDDDRGRTWRRSYPRPSAAERSNAPMKDPATVDVARGWCRVMGLVAMTCWSATAVVVHNLAATDTFSARQASDERPVQPACHLGPDGDRARRSLSWPARVATTPTWRAHCTNDLVLQVQAHPMRRDETTGFATPTRAVPHGADKGLWHDEARPKREAGAQETSRPRWRPRRGTEQSSAGWSD